MKHPKSFAMVVGRRYRVFFNSFTGYWFVAYNDGSVRKRRSLGVKTRPEAEAAVRTLDCPVVVAVKPRALWSEIKAGFLNHKRATGKAPKTLTRYSAALDAFDRYLAKKSIQTAADVTLGVLEGYVPYRTGTEKADPKTAYTDALVIKGAVKWAAKPGRELIGSNPALGWETPEPVKPKRKGYTPAEVATLESGVRRWLRPIITTLAWSGMRIDELINLRWKDVDFDRRVLSIRIQEGWRPKGKRDRTVPLHPRVDSALRGQAVGEYVFRGPRGGKIKESWCLHCLKKDQRRLGLSAGDLHGFRRFFATTMMQAGVSAETVRQWGGWKSLETMLRYLADVDVKDSVTAMDQAVRKLAVG